MPLAAQPYVVPNLHASSRLTLALAAGLSAALHVGGFYLLWAQPKPSVVRRAPIDIEVMSVPTPSPPAAGAKAAAPAIQRPKARDKPLPRPTTTVRPSPASRALAPPAAKAAPMHIGLALQSMTPGASVTVPASGPGGAPGGGPAGDANGASGTSNRQEGALVESFDLTQAPEVDVEPDLRAYYPAAAKRDAEEGQVILQLTIDASGQVTRATVIRSAGKDFDAAATRAALEQLHFKPARREGHVVATKITYTLTFLLD